ncbi:MAG TPA: hypothetical protein VIN10_02425 [Bacteroidales bacterium]
MHRKSYIFLQWAIVILILLCIPRKTLIAQTSTASAVNNSLQSYFIKSELSQKSGELCFNVINIVNPTAQAIRIKTFLNKPEGWALYGTSIKDTVVPAGDTLRLPFRLKIANDASSDISYEVSFEAYSLSNQLLTKSNFTVNASVIRDWNVIVPTNRIFFYPRMNLAQFDVLVENKGNTQEIITLDFQIDKKIELENADGSSLNKVIYLAPHSDTVIKVKANYTFSEEKIFDLSKIQVSASSEEKQVNKSVFIEKYNDTYAPLHVDETLPHTAELGVRFNSGDQEVSPFLKARGQTIFKNESTFNYNFSNYDLSAPSKFLDNSYYRFLYTRNKLNIGVGAFSSQLGRNLYSQNGIMFSNEIQITKTSSLQLFADQDLMNPITSAALGYSYQKNKLDMQSSISYNFNQFTKQNTASIILSSGTIPLFRDHTVSATTYGLREDNYYSVNYYQQGYAWDINYNGWLGKQFSFMLMNNFGSPNIPGSQQGLLNNAIRANYFLGSTKSYISGTYVNTRRNYYYYAVTDSSATKLPNIYLNNQYVAVMYNSHKNLFFTWSVGPSAQLYASRKPFNKQGDYETYEIQRISLEFNSTLFTSLSLNLKGGFRQTYYQLYQETTLDKYDFHLKADYNKNGYGVRFNYDYGPFVNTGLYQSASDFDYNGIMLSPYIFKSYFRNRVSVQLFTNFSYRFDLNYGYLNITPKIETYLAKNWYVVVAGNYGYYAQGGPEYQYDNSVYFAEVSIKKTWGKTDYMAWQKKMRRLKVILFQDDNGNGIKDNFEQGIPYVKTRLKLTIGSDQTTAGHFPVDISLLSNERGTVIYNQIPQGFYELEINPLTDVGEYFYVNKTNKEIDIVKNMTIYIPFQKAAKIEGMVDVKRSKFIRDGSGKINLANIKVTAYNNTGNSYSSFTRNDGSFVIFVPGDTTYYVRMQNVFGSNFIQRQNDISVKVPDSSNKPILFEFVELQRNIKFKQAEPEVPDSLKMVPQKVKILEGKIYENAKSDTLRRKEVPDFNFDNKKSQSQEMEPGKFYVILGETNDINEALKIKKIVDENGLKSQLGIVEGEEKYFIFSNEYSNRLDAQSELDLLKKGGNKKAYIMKYK